MKAAVLEEYGRKGRDLVLYEVPDPEIEEDEVLVRVRTAGVNPLDNSIIRGNLRLLAPYPLPLIPGNELVGEVLEVGEAVEGFRVGERVYGRLPIKKIGAFAELAAVKASALAHVPDYLSDEEAACVPLAALTALQAFLLMDVKEGERVFLSGGTGSLGAMAIPVAKALGLMVITSGNVESKERVLDLGADYFIDYKTEDYAKSLEGVEGVLDTLGGLELLREFAILEPGRTLVSVRGMPNKSYAIRGRVGPLKKVLFGLTGMRYDYQARKKGQKYHFVFTQEDGPGLEWLSEVLEERRVPASVDEVFSIDEVNAALHKVAKGGSKGKTVLRIG